METNAEEGETRDPFYIIFTDLDATLLDHDTYKWKEAVPALRLCKSLNVPVVPVSSKTRAEMEVLRRSLSLSTPFISENGGGIFCPVGIFEQAPQGSFVDNGLWKCSFGLPYGVLVKALQEIRVELGWDIRGFSDMDIDEISHFTGLGREASRLAADREFDEPFVIMKPSSPDMDLLSASAAKKGLKVTQGGRFHHLHGNNHKGKATQVVLSWYEKIHSPTVSIALGDSPNDFDMLELADHPVLVRSDQDYKSITHHIPRLVVTEKKGPAGWNSAVLDILSHKED
ncbi:MAG: HAD-IIB family hydrolase [Desulfatiglans sp.]|jgi:mannosyl-3-phosphoglycerate phosphatase|nr:HAD-IIB family hydrolase [Thermodesulfobacteriota bacterium]MEE4352484.1 HAD-IIB family hydrolase [Desulfatiglans sp.]